MRFSQALLEDWMRDYYFSTEIDLGSSGVESWSFADIRRMCGITHEDLDGVLLQDSTSYGGVELRKAISQRWGNGNPDGVMVTHGSSEAIFLAMITLLEPGDEIIVVDPGYHTLSSIAESISCTVKRWQLPPDRGFIPDVSALQLLVGPRTRMVVVNFPHNPTGVTLTASQQQQLIDIVAGVGAYLIWDAAFVDLTYDSLPLLDPTLSYKRCISVGTFSKAYGLPGLRFGWCMSVPEILVNFLPLRDRLTLHLSPLIEFIALRVIQNVDQLLSVRLKQACQNLDVWTNWVATRGKHVDWMRPYPQGGVTVFPRLRTQSSVEALCHELARSYSTLLVPGTCFGFPNRVRLGFGGPAPDFERGLSQLEDILNRH